MGAAPAAHRSAIRSLRSRWPVHNGQPALQPRRDARISGSRCSTCKPSGWSSAMEGSSSLALPEIMSMSRSWPRPASCRPRGLHGMRFADPLLSGYPPISITNCSSAEGLLSLLAAADRAGGAGWLLSPACAHIWSASTASAWQLSFAGRSFDEQLLRDLPADGTSCGERGEFHTFVSAAPCFSRSIEVRPGEIVERDSFVYA